MPQNILIILLFFRLPLTSQDTVNWTHFGGKHDEKNWEAYFEENFKKGFFKIKFKKKILPCKVLQIVQKLSTTLWLNDWTIALAYLHA